MQYNNVKNFCNFPVKLIPNKMIFTNMDAEYLTTVILCTRVRDGPIAQEKLKSDKLEVALVNLICRYNRNDGNKCNKCMNFDFLMRRLNNK